jgi:hypothetical protein
MPVLGRDGLGQMSVLGRDGLGQVPVWHRVTALLYDDDRGAARRGECEQREDTLPGDSLIATPASGDRTTFDTSMPTLGAEPGHTRPLRSMRQRLRRDATWP